MSPCSDSNPSSPGVGEAVDVWETFSPSFQQLMGTTQTRGGASRKVTSQHSCPRRGDVRGRDKPFARARRVSQHRGTAQHTLVQATRCCSVEEQPFALHVFRTQAQNLAGRFGEHKHLASPLPALPSARGLDFTLK